MVSIEMELEKIRADPDYESPICLGCGSTFDDWETASPFLKLYGGVFRVDACEILCQDCVDAELIEQAKEMGEWCLEE